MNICPRHQCNADYPALFGRGHEVPISKIITRYYKSLLNAAKAISFVDRAYIYGNSVDNQFSRLLLRALDGTSFFVLLFLFPRKTSTEITIAVVVWIDNDLLNDNLRVYHDNFQRMFPWGSTKRRIEPAQIIKHFVTA